MSNAADKLSPAAAALRALGQWLALLPVALALALTNAVPPDPALWLALTLGASLLGAGIALQRRIPPWLAFLLLLAATAAAAVRLGIGWIAPCLYLFAAAVLGSRAFGRLRVSFAGVIANAVVLIAAYWQPELNAYRTLFIVSGIGWLLFAASFGHSRLLDDAGLHDGIVTRLVSRASRRYLLLLLGVVLVVYVATSDFHLWRTIAAWLRGLFPEQGPPEPPPSSAPSMPPDSLPPLPPAGQSAAWTKWLDYAFYAFGGAVVLFLLWYLSKRYLLNRAWLREALAKLGSRLRQLAELLSRRTPPVEPTFTDEKESLLDIGKALRQAQARWRRRGARKPLDRREWDRLAAREKVRRLYEESVLAAVDGGYELRRSDTPAETLDAAARWYEQRAGSGTGTGNDAGEGKTLPAAGRWLARSRQLLAGLYGRARYGSGEATSAELEKLAGEYPWDAKR